MTWRMVEVRERTNHSLTGEKTPEQTDIQDAIQAGTPLRGVLPLFNPDSGVIHNDISPFLFVIPGLTRNPVPSWIPVFTGWTEGKVLFPAWQDGSCGGWGKEGSKVYAITKDKDIASSSLMPLPCEAFFVAFRTSGPAGLQSHPHEANSF